MKWFKNLDLYFINKFNFLNILFSSSFAFLLSSIFYKLLLPICKYTKLNDFYVGTSIFENHNKYLDLAIFFIYVILFFLIYFFNRIKFPQIGIEWKHKYTKVVYLLSIIILSYSIYYFFPTMKILDFHHLGEKIAVYHSHFKYGMKYYKDIMLVHGYLDIIPSYLAQNILGNLNEYNEKICSYFIQIIFLLSNILLCSRIFKRKSFLPICINILLFFNNFSLQIHCLTFVLTFVYLVNNYKNLKYYLWLIIYYLLMIFAIIYHTTFGTAFFISTIPFLIKTINNNKKLGFIINSVFLFLILIFFKNDIIVYFEKASYYITSNLYSFGNNFPQKFNIIRLSISLFCFLIFPTFVILFFKTKNDVIKYLSIFTILIILLMLNYALGRIDESDIFPRAISLSYCILTIILPFFQYKYKSKYFVITNFIIYLLTFCLMINVKIVLDKNYQHFSLQTKKLFLPSKKFIDSITKNDGAILDLNNCGMIYYYLDKKPAIAYTSYYNIVNTKQSKAALKELEQNPPECIILYLKNLTNNLDNIRISQRINPIYRWIFLSNQYKLIKTNSGYFLKHTNISNKIEPIEDLDKISGYDLNYLPDVWGNSIKTLPMGKVEKKINLNNNKILFKDLAPADADLLYIEYEEQGDVAFEITMNNLPSVLKFKSRTERILIPIDNYPTWLLQDEIKEIDFKTSKPISIKKVELYKRN